MWIESSFDLDCHRFRVSIKRLEHDERERVAAQMAWFAQNLVMPDVAVETIGWMSFVQSILLDNVAIAVDEQVLDRLEGRWDEIVWRSMQTFVDVNHLNPTLKMYLTPKPAVMS